MLYLITDPHLCARFGVEQTVDAAVKGGATMVQLRDKHASTEERVSLARRLKPICANHGAVLVINDDVEAAHVSDIDGVHVGQGDMDVALARQIIGADKIVGLAVETVDAESQAAVGIVDYLGNSDAFAKAAKQDHKPPTGFAGLVVVFAD